MDCILFRETKLLRVSLWFRVPADFRACMSSELSHPSTTQLDTFNLFYLT